MPLIQTTAPASEPVTLSELKLYLRVDQSAEDALITALGIAARERCEQHTNRQLITAKYTYSNDHVDFGNRLSIPKPPLVSVQSVKYYDADGTLLTADPSTYRVVSGVEPPYIVFTTVPDFDSNREDGIQVNFTCGYGDATDVPEGVKVAIKWIVANAYANREETEAPMDSSVDRLLHIYRVWR